MARQIVRTLLLACCLLLALPGQAQRVETRLFKKWIVEDEDGSKRLFDMSDKKTWIMAATYTPEDCKMMGEAFKPGVFYEIDRYEVRIKPEAYSSGTIECKMEDGTWIERCAYEDLKAGSVSFVFEGEFVWHSTETNEAITIEQAPVEQDAGMEN